MLLFLGWCFLGIGSKLQENQTITREVLLMKKTRLSFILSILIMSFSMIAICAVIIVPTIKTDKYSGSGTIHVNKNYENNSSSEEVSNPSTDNSQSGAETQQVEFFINSQSVSKNKDVGGEVTMLAVKFEIFASNKTNVPKTIYASAFSCVYDISNYASFYKLEYNQNESSKTIPAGESESFELTMYYVVNNFEDSKIGLQYDLTVNYMSAEVISTKI